MGASNPFSPATPSEPNEMVREEEEEKGAETELSATAGSEVERACSDERSSYKERKENALASGADEGRDKLR